jgi:hypothetical protein
MPPEPPLGSETWTRAQWRAWIKIDLGVTDEHEIRELLDLYIGTAPISDVRVT